MDNHKFQLELGTTAKDIITGFSGVVIGRACYLTGCDQYALTPIKLTTEGKKPKWEWFDDSRLQIVKNKKKIKLNIVKPGFDGNSPIKN